MFHSFFWVAEVHLPDIIIISIINIIINIIIINLSLIYHYYYYLKNVWNRVRLEGEERKDLEIREFGKQELE